MNVYALVDPRSGVEFYVGIAENVSLRMANHFSEANKPKHRCPKHHTIRKLRRAGIKDADMVVILVRDVTPECARYLEECLVAFLGRRNLGEGPLTNILAGGESNPHDDPATHAKYLAAMRKINADPAHKAKVAAAQSDPVWKAKNDARLRGLWKDPVRRAKLLASSRAHLRALSADPVFAAKRDARLRALWKDPVFKAKVAAGASAHCRVLNADPIQKAKSRAHMLALHANPVWKAKSAARIRAYWARYRAEKAAR